MAVERLDLLGQILDTEGAANPSSTQQPQQGAANASKGPSIEGPSPNHGGRLTVGQTVATLAQMGTAIQRLGENFSKIPESNPNDVEMLLKAMVDYCKGIQAKAERLIAGNR